MSSKPLAAIADDQNRLAFTVDQFCHFHNISRPFFYKMMKGGTGPRIMKLGAKTLVSHEAAAAWRKEREGVIARARRFAA